MKYVSLEDEFKDTMLKNGGEKLAEKPEFVLAIRAAYGGGAKHMLNMLSPFLPPEIISLIAMDGVIFDAKTVKMCQEHLPGAWEKISTLKKEQALKKTQTDPSQN
jgi:hypothetical protein